MLKKYFILAIISCFTFVAKSQCSATLLPSATKKLADFTYVKDFQIKLRQVRTARDKKQITMSVMLNKGTKYRFVLDDSKDAEGRLIFELFSDKGKRQVSSFRPEIKKHYYILEYICNASGMYFLNFEFEDFKAGCGVLVYGFKPL